jgi:hypothetical protein
MNETSTPWTLLQTYACDPLAVPGGGRVFL